MRLINPGFYFYEDEFNQEKIKRIERAGRLCYKSESKGDPYAFIKDKCYRGHTSVIEHEKVTVYVVCDRGVSHELVRHRIGSYSQESTRYCNYTKDKFGKQITYINIPDSMLCCNAEEDLYNLKAKKAWLEMLRENEISYNKMIEMGSSPQIARSILCNALKTEIAITMNFRSWRNFFTLRTAEGAHPQMRQIACPMLDVFKTKFPAVFDDISYPKLADDVSSNIWIYSARNDEEMDKFIKEYIMGEKEDGNILNRYISSLEIDNFIQK